MTPASRIPHMLAHRRLACALVSAALVAGCGIVAPGTAHAVTAAEKRAEADEVFAQIDSLQTNLNEAIAEYDRARDSYDDAISKRDQASADIEAESAHIQQLQGELADFARGMYKQGAGTFIDVIFESESFEQFLTTWDACSTIAQQGQATVDKAEAARATLEEARTEYERQSTRAQDEMAVAEDKQAEIEATQEALRTEAERLSAEADELQRQEELAAEAARQAEEARKKREAELEAARKAEEERLAKAAQAAQATGDEVVDEGEEGGGPDVETLVIGPGFLANPCPSATSSSGFGYRTFDNSFHKGLDMAAGAGTPYYAAESGTVMYATNDGGYNGGAGNWVVISHGNGVVTKYMHSSATYVRPGDYVERGQEIGAVGNTGNSFGPHLHFQVEINGVAVNPLNYI